MTSDIVGQTHDEEGTRCFVCPCCSKRSYHPKDREQGYCNLCSWWTGRPDMPDCPKHTEKLVAICEPCREAADTGDMSKHCNNDNNACFCQHKGTDKYPVEKKNLSGGNYELSDTPKPGARDVKHF